MFKSLIRKFIGRKAAIAVDPLLQTAADAVTGGKASDIEDVVKRRKRKR
jgi:hypothetical protein